MTNTSVLFAGKLLIVLVAGLIMLINARPIAADDSARWNWEAVESELIAGKPVRLGVRVTGAGFQAPATDMTVTTARLDMSPDGMAEMTVPVRVIGASGGNILMFEAELSMAGRWSLSFTASVTDEQAPIIGTVVFTAVEKQAKACAFDLQMER